jgi:hypothetical protein
MSILSKKIDEGTLQAFRDDPIAFVRAFDREPWDYQADILRQVVERDQAGRFTKSIAIVSMPRQNGKSTISTWIALWRLYCDPDEQEIISVALDRAGAQIILGDARRIISRSQVLYSCLDRHGLTRDEIRLKDGRRWMIRPSDAAYSRGYRPSMIAYDELGWAVDRNLFDVLSSGQAAQRNPLMLATSTVGPLQAGVLWDLFEAARANDPNVRLIYETENKSPKITEAYLERQRQVLPAHVFAREHMNLWGEGSEAFATEQDWQRAISEGDPRRRSDAGPCKAFLDLGWVHDESVLTVAKENEDGKTEVIALEVWQGSQREPVNFAAIRKTIEKLAKRMNITELEIESPQGVSMAQELNLRGVNTRIHHPTAKGQQERWGAFYTSLKAGTVLLPNDATLRRQLLTLTIRSTTSGWKVVDQPSIHQDRAMACAGVVFMVQEGAAAQGIETCEVNPFYSGVDPKKDLARIGDRYVFLPGHNQRPHPQGVTWQTCRHRSKGCASCIDEMTALGIYSADTLLDEARAENAKNRQEEVRQDAELEHKQAARIGAAKRQVINNFWARVNQEKRA